MKKLQRSGFWNSANTITVLRIVAVPIVMVLLANESRSTSLIACGLFILASVSDFVDGYLARKYNLESIIGAFLDPLADKLLVTGAMIMLVPLGRIDAWLVAIIILRDLTITSLRAIAASEGMIIAASNWGKYKTTFENTGLCFLIYHYPSHAMDPHDVGIILMWIGMVLAVGSGLHYLWQFIVNATE